MFTRLLTTVSIPVLLGAAACTAEPSGVEEKSAAVEVCSEDDPADACEYVGLTGLQTAIDASSPGDQIMMQAGTYRPVSYRDVPFQELQVRGAVVIGGKTLEIVAEPGARISGSADFPSSALVIEDSTVQITGLTISGFHYAEAEDDIYDGHGIFTINSDVTLNSVTIERVAKMALTGREDGRITAKNLVIDHSHLGVWLEETATIDMTDSQIIFSESAAVAAYGNASAVVSDSVVESNQDDGLYTEDNARIISRNSALLDNSPFGARAAGNSLITVCGGSISGNAEAFGEEEAGRVIHDDGEACKPV